MTRTSSDGFVLWLTGLSAPASRRSARSSPTSSRQRGLLVERLDGDVVRTHLSKGLGFSKEDRDTNIERIGWVASRLARAGAAVVVSAISPYDEARRNARALVEEHASFVLVHVATRSRSASGATRKACTRRPTPARSRSSPASPTRTRSRPSRSSASRPKAARRTSRRRSCCEVGGARTPGDSRMKLLVLGGTQFVGRAIATAALERGHELTLFNRGRTNPDLFPKAEHLHGDRDGDLSALAGRSFDAVIDTVGLRAASRPRVGGAACRLGRALRLRLDDRRLRRLPTGPDERAPRLQWDGVSEDVNAGYGSLKAACEEVVEEVYGGRALSSGRADRRAARSDLPLHLLGRRGSRAAARWSLPSRATTWCS